MDVEDFAEPEVGVAVAVTAVAASPKVRRLLRQSAVYGVAAVLSASEAATALFHRVKAGAQDMAAAVKESAAKKADETPQVRHKTKSGA